MIAERPEAPPLRMTEDEFEAWCMAEEHCRAEYVDGEVILKGVVTIEHHDLSRVPRVLLGHLPGAAPRGSAAGL
jgi:hypothetical protein